ncbi:MAG: Hsp20/alpha crystallin family protein [Candidatus Micrarchaeota archaeon]
MKRMYGEMDSVFDDFFPGLGFFAMPQLHTPLPPGSKGRLSAEGKPGNLFRANADMYETDDEIVAKFDMPGVNKSDMQVEVTENALVVKVEKKSEHEEKKKDSYFMERSYSGYYRSLPLPPYTKSEDVKAYYKDGVLTVKIPKEEEKKKAKKIEVE